MKLTSLRIIDEWLQADTAPKVTLAVRERFIRCCDALGVAADLASGLSQSNFKSRVLHLKLRKRTASKQFGTALLKSREFEDAGENRLAIKVFEQFVKRSIADAYVELAQKETKRIRRKL
jgi:hypothetical protein